MDLLNFRIFLKYCYIKMLKFLFKLILIVFFFLCISDFKIGFLIIFININLDIGLDKGYL